MTDQHTVRAGTIIADCDPRMSRRTLRVEAVDSRYAYCVTVDPSTRRTWGVSRRTRILLDRIRGAGWTGRSGFRLVQDAEVTS